MKKISSETNMNLSRLPKGWIWIKLGSILSPSKEKINPSISKNEIFVGLEHIESHTGKIIGFGRSSEIKSTKSRFHSGDILYGRLRPYLNKVCVPTFDGICSTDILVFQKNDYLESGYIARYLLTSRFVQFASQHMSGVQHPRVSYEIISHYDVPLAPLQEQNRIVSKLEDLLSELDVGIIYLKRTRILLKQYHQSILKSAFEGRLTEKWRYEYRDKIPTIGSQLENLKNERPQYKKNDFPLIEPYALHELPREWVWIRVQDIVNSMQYGTSEKANDDSTGIPVVRMGNIQNGKIIFDNLKYYRSSHWLNEFLLSEGDVLFNRTNSAELVGKSAVYEPHYPKSVFASYLIRLKVLKKWYHPKLLSFFINSIYGKKYLKSVVSQQVGQANINSTKLAAMPIPFFSTVEQNKLVEKIETKLSIMMDIETLIQRTQSICENLRQTILKNAFEGKLVPQYPTDEPAAILLERIEKERELRHPVKKGISKISREKLFEGQTDEIVSVE